MSKTHRSRQTEPDRATSTRHEWLVIPVLLLLATAMVSNIYLTHLYVDVQRAGGVTVDSFCNVNESVHCSAVAASRYSAVLGVPVALIATEFYLVVIAMVVLSRFRLWALEKWESLLFWAMVAGLPVTLLMAYIAAFRLHILCPLCALTYGVNLSILVLLVLTYLRHFKDLLREGPAELRQVLAGRSVRLGIAALLLVGLSQLLWYPSLVRRVAQAQGDTPVATRSRSAHPLAGEGATVGPADAVVRIIEFSDYQCSVCRHGHDIMAQVLRDYRGQLRFEHRDFPLDNACNREVKRPFHPDACRATYFARCAEAQGRFWPYIELLFHHQDMLNESGLEALARRVGLDLTELRQCARRREIHQAVLNDIEEGIRRRVEGTPTFFLNGKRVVGPRDLPWWRGQIQRLLGTQAAAKAER